MASTKPLKAPNGLDISMTTVQKNALTNKVVGQLVYDSTLAEYQKWNGSAFVNIGGGSQDLQSVGDIGRTWVSGDGLASVYMFEDILGDKYFDLSLTNVDGERFSFQINGEGVVMQGEDSGLGRSASSSVNAGLVSFRQLNSISETNVEIEDPTVTSLIKIPAPLIGEPSVGEPFRLAISATVNGGTPIYADANGNLPLVVSGGGGGITSIVAGTNVTIDSTIPTAPIVNVPNVIKSINTAITPDGVGNVTLNLDNIPDGTANKGFTATEKAKLLGIATGATANQTDAYLLNRANQTGTQAVTTLTGTLPIANGGTGLAALGTTLQLIRVNAAGTALEYYTPTPKVDANTAITGATKTKITYDAKGLVTAGADLIAADIPNIAQSQVTGLISDISARSLISNKQNSLAPDGTGVKYVTVDAVNANVRQLFYRNFATSAATTAAGTVTQFYAIPIPANTFQSGSEFELYALFQKTGTTAGGGCRIFLSTTAVYGTGTQTLMASASVANLNKIIPIKRTVSFNSATTVKVFDPSVNSFTDDTAANTDFSSTFAFDTAALNYIIIAGFASNIADTLAGFKATLYGIK